MRKSAEHRNVEPMARLHVRSSSAAADVGRTRREHASFWTMSSAAAEFQYKASVSRLHAAGSLGRNAGLKSERGEQIGFDQLRFDGWRRDSQQRFRGKHRGALFYSPNFSLKTKLAKIIEELPAHVPKDWLTLQKFDLFRIETETFQILDSLLQSCRNQVPAVIWKAAHEQLKRCRRVQVIVEISRRHREFVQIGLQSRVVHPAK